MRVTYDDEEVSYERLLDAAWELQRPRLGSRQYASVVFPHDDSQREAAEAWLGRNRGRRRDSDGWRAEWTTVEPLGRFFRAEGYHQRYWQKQRPRLAVMAALLAVSAGLLDPVVPVGLQVTVETAAIASVVTMGVLIMLERFLDAKVVEVP